MSPITFSSLPREEFSRGALTERGVNKSQAQWQHPCCFPFTARHLGKVSYKVSICEVNYLLPKTAMIKTRAASPSRKCQLSSRKVLKSQGLRAWTGWMSSWGTSTWRPSPLGSSVPSRHLVESPRRRTRSQSFSPAPIIQLWPALKASALFLGQVGHVAFVTVSWWTMIRKFSFELQQLQWLCSQGLSLCVEQGLLRCLYISWFQEIHVLVA